MSGTREKLIDTAHHLFYEHGFHAIGLDRILADVGVTKTTFYNHFESRDELIVEVLREADSREIDQFMAAVGARGGDDPRAQLLAMFDVLEEKFAQPEFRGCIYINAATAFPDPRDPIHAAAAAHRKEVLRRVRQMADRAGVIEAEGLADQLMILLTGCIVSRHAGSNPEAARIARTTSELLLERYLPPVFVGAK
jgi:AcrR family transcriptional regulator